MFMFKKVSMPAKDDALPGRSTPIRTATEHFVNGNPLKGPYPAGLETAIFGLGCFWGAERKFWELGDGIYTTAVGYAGGYTPNPTYEEVCSGRTGHNEVVLVAYDPKKVSYEKLLKTFWENHDPTQGMRQGNDVGTQYRSGIYTTTPAQKKAAEARKKQKVIEVKEIKLRPNIDDNDYDVKMRAAHRFLEEGDKVKVTMRFRGRELSHGQLGMNVLQRVAEQVQEIAKVEAYPRMEGRQMLMVLAPK